MNPTEYRKENLFLKIVLLRLILFFGFLMIGYSSFAQKSNFLNIGAGFEHIAHRDLGMSPLMYSGNGFFTEFSWQKKSPQQTLEIAINFAKGLQRSKFENAIEYNKGNIQAYIFYHQNRSVTNRILWGWSNNNVFSHRYNQEFVNFNHHFDYFTNFGPAVKYVCPLKIKNRDLSIEGVANFQLIGFIIRPSYTSSYPEGFLREETSIVKNLVHSVRFSHPGNSLNFGLHPRLNYFLKSGNRLSLSYQYELYRLSPTNLVSQSSGIWFISLSTRL
jgi:hypothetical protein